MQMDENFMRRALALAERGRGAVSPNPMVGAVLVRDGEIVGEGFHARLGGPHAEVEALQAAGPRARGATLYVTLEPCNHTGRTPPCAPAVHAAGVVRVVAAMADPNPTVQGGGLHGLRERGVDVECGLCEAEAREQNRTFSVWARQRRPFVTLKTAMTADGRIACHTGHSRWITGEAARRRVHEERAHHDAILVGVGTVIADRPRLDVRLDDRFPSPSTGSTAPHRQPRPVVLDSTLRTPLDTPLLQTRSERAAALVFCTPAADAARQDRIRAAGAEAVVVSSDAEGHVKLSDVLHDLAQRRITSLFVEGGGTVTAAFLRGGFADRVLTFVAPLVIGGAQAPTPLGLASPPIEFDAPPLWRLKRSTLHPIGEDVCIEGFLREDW